MKEKIQKKLMKKLFNKFQNPYFRPFPPHFLRHSPPPPQKNQALSVTASHGFRLPSPGTKFASRVSRSGIFLFW